MKISDEKKHELYLNLVDISLKNGFELQEITWLGYGSKHHFLHVESNQVYAWNPSQILGQGFPKKFSKAVDQVNETDKTKNNFDVKENESTLDLSDKTDLKELISNTPEINEAPVIPIAPIAPIASPVLVNDILDVKVNKPIIKTNADRQDQTCKKSFDLGSLIKLSSPQSNNGPIYLNPRIKAGKTAKAR